MKISLNNFDNWVTTILGCLSIISAILYMWLGKDFSIWEVIALIGTGTVLIMVKDPKMLTDFIVRIVSRKESLPSNNADSPAPPTV